MSRVLAWVRAGAASFPRVSGDEPLRTSGMSLYSEFSPRERG